MAHEALKSQYEKDLQVNPKAYIAWQFKHDNTEWETCYKAPEWAAHNQYRRHPHADLILSHKPGDQWQCSADGGKSWCGVVPEWVVGLDYRRKKPHTELQAQYEKDLLVNPNAYVAWEYGGYGQSWRTCQVPPDWNEKAVKYRRHPHADLMLTYDPSTVYEFKAADKPWQPWQTVSNPPLWDEKLNYRKKFMTHELERKQYEADKLTYSEPHLLWEYLHCGWNTMQQDPCWDDRIQYRRKPEARPHAHLIMLWAEGAEIEKMNHRDQWVPCPNPCWESSGVYRQKPATQTRFIPVFRMPAGSVYVGGGKISLEDCKPQNDFDKLISVLEISVDRGNTVTLVKKHKCEI